MFDNGVGGMSW